MKETSIFFGEDNGAGKCGTGSHDYFVYSGVSEGVNWDDAKSFCENSNGFGGSLASLECKEEHDFVLARAHAYGGSNQVIWTGGYRKSGNGADKIYTDVNFDSSW